MNTGSKGGEYEVLGVAQAPLVIYRALYGAGGLWARPLEMWNETVLRDGAAAVPRFVYLGRGDADSG